MKTLHFDIFGWHLFKARKDAKGKVKAIIIEGLTDDKPKIAVACPECGKPVYPLTDAGGPLPIMGYAEFSLPVNWPETGNILLSLTCLHCNWTGKGWFALVEIRP